LSIIIKAIGREEKALDYAPIHGIDDLPAIDTVTSEPIGMPCQDTVSNSSLYL
jgi:hypothetical protein